MLGRVARTHLFAIALLGAAACASGCSGDSESAPEVEPVTRETVEVPVARLSPFCQAMIDLADELEANPPDDVEQAILDAYEAIEPEVPGIVRDDFDAVLAALRGEPIPPTTDSGTTTSTTTTTTTTTSTTISPTAGSDPTTPPATDETGATLPAGDAFFEEGYVPGETPAERLNEYVDFVCRGIQNNPGPPATQPLSGPSTSEG